LHYLLVESKRMSDHEFKAERINLDGSDIVASLLRRDTPVRFKAHGPSMNPTLRDGDLVQVIPPQIRRLRRGAIVLFQQHGRLTLHRLIGFAGSRPSRLLVCGDASVAGYETTAREHILGIAVWVKQGGRQRDLFGPSARLRGLLRYYARPLRRFLIQVRRGFSHGPTSTN
jgi:hypothetical protein